MAENEIVKHVESAYKAVINQEKHWLQKLKEVLIEIFIIVFAVSLSIWFHNWSDSLHEHKEEREFLTGLRKDIQADIASLKTDSTFYSRALIAFKYFQRVAAGEQLAADSMKAYQDLLFRNIVLEPHISRYEGLKGSGKLGIIGNTELLNNIIDLHEVTIKRVETVDGDYTGFADRISNFIQDHGDFNLNNNTFTNAQDVLRMPPMKFFLHFGKVFISGSALRAHASCIIRCQQLISQIDEELK
jgi:hypothetical protein